MSMEPQFPGGATFAEVGLQELRAAADNLRPSEVVDSARNRSQSSFLLLYPDPLLLLVRLKEDSGDLATVLAATQADLPSTRSPLKPTGDHMGFHTEIHRFASRPKSAGTPQSSFDVPALTSRLRDARYFIVPLRKRASVDALSLERISVGRARNKDIVLRDASVSKFHGWFTMDEYRAFQFADAGSKNGTSINGRRMEARQPLPLNPGDSVVIGSVETLLCPPDILWKALNGQ
ncbi:MAG TPA: FHA domain-containing protein [Polyangiaceae bacterium]|nr:FHA domain-containing protein [Polyangiaceae bacterium]